MGLTRLERNYETVNPAGKATAVGAIRPRTSRPVERCLALIGSSASEPTSLLLREERLRARSSRSRPAIIGLFGSVKVTHWLRFCTGRYSCAYLAGSLSSVPS